MGQTEVIELLKKSGKPLTSKEITSKLGLSSANNSLRKLVKYNEIKIIHKIRGIHNVKHNFI